MIPQGWTEKTLDEVCSFSRGLTYSKNDEVEFSDNVILRANNIDLVSNSLNFDELKYITSTFAIPEDKKVKENSIMICISSGSKSHLGKVAFIDRDYGYAFGGFMGLMTPKENINPKYLYYMLITPSFKDLILHLTDGANINNLKYNDLKNFKLNIPPLPEQERIVAKLDKAFEAIDKVKANAEQNLNNAKELYKVVLNKVFNSNKYQFEHIKLDDLCEIITDGTHQTPTYADKGVIFLSAKNVTSEVIDWENIKYIPDSLHNELKKRVSPQKGDILLAKNGTTGVAAIVDRDCVFDIYVSLCMLRPKKTVNVQYLLLAINNPITKDKFNKSLIGIGVPNLHLNKIRETTVPIPSPKFQDEISSLLNGLKAEYLKLEQIYTQKIKECDELKQSILQKAFRGEL